MGVASLALSGVSTLTNLIGGMQSAGAQSAAANYQAQVARNNAVIARQDAVYAAQVGGTKAQAQDLKNRAQLGDIYSAQAASGIDTEMGTPAAVRDSAASIGRLDTETIYSNALNTARGHETQARNYDAQAGLYESQASNAKTAGLISGFGSLVGGATSFADKWSRYQGSG